MNKVNYNDAVSELIHTALKEDLGTGDITTMTVIGYDREAHGRYIAKEDGVICGLDILADVYAALDGEIRLVSHKKDGDFIKKGDLIAEVFGKARYLLSGERVGLNLLQHLSGIATATNTAVSYVKDYPVKITDTRKTTPGMRVLEKYAVRVGGGTNHRFGLADGILIKDNHIVAAGSITAAVRAARQNAPHTLKIEVEAESREQAMEALDAGADIIMLDNMSCAEMAECVKMIQKRALVEASGNMGQRDLREVASTGVDLISIGALTHSVKALDISLKFTMI